MVRRSENLDCVEALLAWLENQEISYEDGIAMMVDAILLALFENARNEDAAQDHQFFGYQMHVFICKFLTRAQQFWETEQIRCDATRK